MMIRNVNSKGGPVEFASQVTGLTVKRVEKRSRRVMPLVDSRFSKEYEAVPCASKRGGQLLMLPTKYLEKSRSQHRVERQWTPRRRGADA